MRKSKYVFVADDSITLRTERVVGNKIDFNEVLSVLYREGQKMSWHDDGEPGMSLL
jgi:alkylated DNA repair dioxygenase AlkB